MEAYAEQTRALIEGGVQRAFTLPGLGISWSLPAFKAREKDLDVVLTRSEWIGSIMAQVTGRLTGRPAALMGQGAWMQSIGSRRTSPAAPWWC